MGSGNSKLGIGTFGEVHKAKIKGKIVAVKRFRPDVFQNSKAGTPRDIIQEFCREYEAIGRLISDHPNIVAISRVDCKIGRSPSLCMVTEFLEFDLQTFLEQSISNPKIYVEDVAKITGQCATALDFLHNLDTPITHRNLSPQNVLLQCDENSVLRVKIADAGLAQTFQATHGRDGVRIIARDDRYMAPETVGYVCSGRMRYEPKIDIFSLGMVMLEMINGHSPEPMSNPLENQQGANGQPFLHKDVEEMGDQHPLRQIVLSCLANDPRDRPTAAEILEKLEDSRTEIIRYDFQKKVNLLVEAFQRWIPVRRRTIRELEELDLDEMVRKLNSLHRYANIATASSSSVALVAGLVSIGAFVAAFFTAGVAIPIAVAGGVVAAVGGFGTIGAKFTERGISKSEMKKVGDVMALDIRESEELRQLLQEFDELLERNAERYFADQEARTQGKDDDRLLEYFKRLTGSQIFQADQNTDLASGARGISATLSAAAAITMGAADGARIAASTLEGLSSISRASHIAGGVAVILALPIDIYFIVTSLRELKNDSPSSAANAISKMRDQLASTEDNDAKNLVHAYIGIKVMQKVEKKEIAAKKEEIEIISLSDIDNYCERSVVKTWLFSQSERAYH